MCVYCRALKPLSIGILPIEKATQCDELWKIWCEQNREGIEQEVMSWLDKNSRCVTIMKLHGLKPSKHKGLSSSFNKQ